MKYNRLISLLVLCIVILSIFASVIGIFSNAGSGAHEIESFRGETVNIHGRGLLLRSTLFHPSKVKLITPKTSCNST